MRKPKQKPFEIVYRTLVATEFSVRLNAWSEEDAGAFFRKYWQPMGFVLLRIRRA